ncbi:MAG TPA: DUF167 domain-containing protein [Gammaproteobacteria bacterium]|nr:DUF167 domain-containing protein [Gammaproteobacteria bacterium]
MSTSFYRKDGDAFILLVRVQPGARSDAIVGAVDGVLRVRLKAPAREGRANDALRAFLAERLGTAPSRVEILKGGTGRSKRVAVRGARFAPETLLSEGS